MYVPRFFVSSQQRFGATDVKAPGCHSSRSWTNRVIALRQISVTALFYLEDSRRIHPRNVRTCQPKGWKRREWRRVWGERERRERVRERERAHACGQGKREKETKRKREREREQALWLLLLYVFSSTWAFPMQIGLSQECGLFYLKSSLQSLDLSLTFLCSIFAGFSLPCLLATAIWDSFSLF